MSFLSFFKDKISYLLSIIFLQITIAIFLMPYTFYVFSNNSKLFIEIFLVIICSIIYIYGLLITSGTAYIPYKTFV